MKPIAKKCPSPACARPRSVRWSRKTGRKGQETRQTLYQCDCGYDHKARNSKLRCCPVNFTSCLAHVEVLSVQHTGKILRICGYFEHNQGCKSAFLARIPPIPLHPSVFAHALKQLQIGVQLTDIEAENRRMFQASQYPGQPRSIRESSYRWLIRKSDTRSLYRQFNRLRGIHTATAAHLNIDDWLDTTSPAYNPAFTNTVFHYSPRATKNEHFEVCISTADMRNAAWRYAHGSQLILDGTFGLCDRKLLLFILMATDEKGRGVPLVFLLFSAPSGNQQTSLGYNTEVLTRLLGHWRELLGDQDGHPFTPRVAITDTDLKERGALLKVFEDIWLLLCKFHTAYHTDIRNRLCHLEAALMETRSHEAAKAHVAEERRHVDYLSNYWLDIDLWKSWSLYGREFAAERLGCEVEGVIPTTNHLESFNGHGGRRLRVDVLLHVFVFSILPSIFEARKLDADEEARIAAQIRSLPGGAQLLTQTVVETTAKPQAHHPYAFLSPDPERDAAAQALLERNQISVPTYHEQSRTFEFDCFSSLATAHDTSPVMYTLSLGLDTSATCSCPDFQNRGGACKHLRAALLRLEHLRSEGISIPAISLPHSEDNARARSATAPSESDLPDSCLPTTANPVERTACFVNEVLQDKPLAGTSSEAELLSDATGISSGPEDMSDEEPDNALSESDGNSASRGFQRQIVAHVLHDLQVDGPKLRQLGEYLEDVPELVLSEVSRAQVAKEHLDALAVQLSRLLIGTENTTQSAPSRSSLEAEKQTGAASSTASTVTISTPSSIPPTPATPLSIARSSTLPPPLRRKKRRASLVIFPASPEKAQKRQDSHSIH
ncbi:hypothetical protein LXA43DRAFT_977164 [Ganoderma leucocontextum]|nr:hypothetical protein LXA43DRAFT_977164 [Ganoderma leucocontextum]